MVSQPSNLGLSPQNHNTSLYYGFFIAYCLIYGYELKT
ncbi:hypothetical protein AO372_0620 [Moraxella catarrhalis]|nr:hypothetical protein AO372_0620 [Moraxella catarrhalis]